MFRFSSEKKLRDGVSGAEAYLRQHHLPPKREPVPGFRDDGARFSLEIGDPYGGAARLRRDGYDPGAVDRVMDAQSSGRSPEELDALLARAGHALSHSSKRDVVIEYFFRERIYDLTYVNLVLDRLRLRKLGR